MKMREYLYCFLFGHRFIGIHSGKNYYLINRKPLDYCDNCGLSKKELKEME